MHINRRTLFGKLNTLLFKSLESASVLCKLRGNPYVEIVHWFNQIILLPDSDVHRLTAHYQLRHEVLSAELASSLSQLPSGATAISDFSSHIDKLVERAWTIASLHTGASSIRSAHLIIALLHTPELKRVAEQCMPSLIGIKLAPSDNIMSDVLLQSPENMDGSSVQQTATSVPGEQSLAINPTDHLQDPLQQYCTDLTQQARDGKIDPVIGRDHEIRTMIDILLRRRQNNPLLTGEAGVGKTAVVEGLALAIVQKTVPSTLQSVRLLSLDLGALLAGASMKGEFESRLKKVLHAAEQSPAPMILFVDEVHTLMGAGGQAGTGDAANLLKPALARGTLRSIGATTWDEYKRYIEKDPAFTRRFQVLQICEPDEEQALAMVRGLSNMFSQHHGVFILEEAMHAAVALSHRYLPTRQLPDKAISLLDTACARTALSLQAPPERITFIKAQLASANLEKSFLLREQTIGINVDLRMAPLTKKITTLEENLQTINHQWQQERQLVSEILSLREALVDASTPEQTLQALHHTEQQLAQCQGDTPLISAQVDVQAVTRVVADWTGIPVGRMAKNEQDVMLSLADQLGQRVIGQDHALQQISRCIRTARAQLADPDKPIGVFLLAGPSGVGKTETALALAETLYGGEHNLITINMSEFQETHSISTLKGAPPGYVGYGEGGVLTEAVRKRPHSVILLDEIEKAHPDVYELFYQVFDKGWMEDGEGRHINFKNTVILMTTNASADFISKLVRDEATIDTTALITQVHTVLRETFPAAFLGRMITIPYLPLTASITRRIVAFHLNKVVERMHRHHGVALHINDAVIDHIIAQTALKDTGIRALISFIELHILPELANIWLMQSMADNPCKAINITIDTHQSIHFEQVSAHPVDALTAVSQAPSN
jgi:type VI secretion system protein VasG